MASSRERLLSDPRSGAKPLVGGARQSRPPRDQASRDDLARARRKRPANTAAQPETQVTAPPRSPARRPRPTPPVGKPRETRPLPVVGAGDQAAAPEPGAAAPSSRSYTTDGAGAFLALFVYPFAMNFLRGGNAQAIGWVKAKWLNQPYGAPAPPGGQGGKSGPANLSAPHDMRRVQQ